MIQPLRTAHRRVSITLAFVLPTVLLAGLGARRPYMPLRVEATQLLGSTQLVRKSDSLWQKHEMQMEFYSDANRPGGIQVALHPAQELNEPDLLLYWSVEQPTRDSLPAAAELLGPFASGRAFGLPLNVNRAGYLILFSLAHQSVIDTAKVEKLP